MVDTVSPERRSAIMANIRSRDTAPELMVRSYLHSRGLRYRLHGRALPGKPDLVFSSRNVCVFVHGCFWHGCPKCVDGTRSVKSNASFWTGKVAGNRARDGRNVAALEAAGWTVLTIWECEVVDSDKLAQLTAAIKNNAIGRRRAEGKPGRAWSKA
jgi:DNA mismatch endonuclease (patch repair protein)